MPVREDYQLVRFPSVTEPTHFETGEDVVRGFGIDPFAASPGWTDVSTAPGAAVWDNVDLNIDLTAGSGGERAAIRQQMDTLEIGATYQITIDAPDGALLVRVGETAGGQEMKADTSLSGDDATTTFVATVATGHLEIGHVTASTTRRVDDVRVQRTTTGLAYLEAHLVDATTNAERPLRGHILRAKSRDGNKVHAPSVLVKRLPTDVDLTSVKAYYVAVTERGTASEPTALSDAFTICWAGRALKAPTLGTAPVAPAAAPVTETETAPVTPTTEDPADETPDKWLSPNGLDTNDGNTELTAYQTPQKLADNMTTAGLLAYIKGDAGSPYTTAMLIKGEGTAASPRIFKAKPGDTPTFNGSAVKIEPDGWVSDNDDTGASTNKWARFIGLKFTGGANGLADDHTTGTTYVRMAQGYTLECCTLTGGQVSVNIRGADCQILDSTLQQANGFGILGSNADRLKILRTVSKDHNLSGNFNPSNSAVFKLLFTDSILIEDFEASGSRGPGIWADFRNNAWIIRRAFCHNLLGRTSNFEGPGIFIEFNGGANGGDFVIEDSRCYDNAGAEINIAESKTVTIRRCRLSKRDVQLGHALIDLRNLKRSTPQSAWIQTLTIVDNQFQCWGSGGAVKLGGGEWNATSEHPAWPQMGFVIDRNQYDSTTVPVGTVVANWKNSAGTATVTYQSVSEFRAATGFEQNATAGVWTR